MVNSESRNVDELPDSIQAPHLFGQVGRNVSTRIGHSSDEFTLENSPPAPPWPAV